MLIIFKKLLVIASGFNQRCSGNEECDKSKNLVCIGGICQCKDLSIYWNERLASCGKFGSVLLILCNPKIIEFPGLSIKTQHKRKMFRSRAM